MPTSIIYSTRWSDTKSSIRGIAGIPDSGDTYCISVFCQENTNWYKWVPTSADADDDDIWLKPTAFTSENGRWRKQ